MPNFLKAHHRVSIAVVYPFRILMYQSNIYFEQYEQMYG